MHCHLSASKHAPLAIKKAQAKKTPPWAGVNNQAAECLALVDGVLERLASRELDGLRGRDLDGLARLRVAAGACCTLARAEAAEANQLNRVALRHCLLDHFEQRVQRFAGLSLAGARLSSDGVDQFLFVH